jgi:outer membrane protein assembly factor BamB
MKTGSLRTIAAVLGLATAVASDLGCASRPREGRDETLQRNIETNFGFTGRKLAVDLGQAGPVQLRASETRLQGDLLVLVAEPNHIEVLNRDTLMAEWAYHSLPGAIRYAPIQNGLSMLAMSSNELHQIELNYGHATPPIHYDMSPSSAFGATAGTAYVPSWGGATQKTIRTLNLVTGLEGWGYRTPGDIRGGIVVGGQPPRQTLYFATDAGVVYGMAAAEASARGPEPSWSFDTHGPVTAPLFVDGDDLFAASQSGFLYCMDRVTGGVKWAAAHETTLEAGPVATKGFVYQVRTGEMWCHERATGKVLWKVKGAERLVAERDGKSYVVAGTDLWAIAKDGAVTGKLPLNGLYCPTNLKDDSIYTVSGDGFIFKLEKGGE